MDSEEDRHAEEIVHDVVESFHALKQGAQLVHTTLIRMTEEGLTAASIIAPAFTHRWREEMCERFLAAFPKRHDRFVFLRDCRAIQRRLGMPEPFNLPFMDEGERVAPSFQVILDAVFRRALKGTSERERRAREVRMNRLWPARWAFDEYVEELRKSGAITSDDLRSFCRGGDVRDGFRCLLSPRLQHRVLRKAEDRFEENGLDRIALIRLADPPEVPPVLTDDAVFLLKEYRFELLRRHEPSPTAVRRRSA